MVLSTIQPTFYRRRKKVSRRPVKGESCVKSGIRLISMIESQFHLVRVGTRRQHDRLESDRQGIKY